MVVADTGSRRTRPRRSAGYPWIVVPLGVTGTLLDDPPLAVERADARQRRRTNKKHQDDDEPNAAANSHTTEQEPEHESRQGSRPGSRPTPRGQPRRRRRNSSVSNHRVQQHQGPAAPPPLHRLQLRSRLPRPDGEREHKREGSIRIRGTTARRSTEAPSAPPAAMAVELGQPVEMLGRAAPPAVADKSRAPDKPRATVKVSQSGTDSPATLARASAGARLRRP